VAPRYVIGTEVPTPGGVKSANERLSVTLAEEAEEIIALTKREFVRLGLEDAWERVIAVVVQPGVEYGDQLIHEYKPERAAALSKVIEAYDSLIYEAHSTDFQTRGALRELVRDHFAILKVGPALTFAFREAVFALSIIEQNLLKANLINGEISNLQSTLDRAMLEHPEDWEKYYTGDPEQQRFSRMYSYSDRSRYYWPALYVQEALKLLLSNLSQGPIPLSLLSQFMPLQYQRVREGLIDNRPRALILDRITSVLRDYAHACGLE
jgi:D-tagatose-1,6-bisphosphate aldolase subunit GatZ/KbaZ